MKRLKLIILVALVGSVVLMVQGCATAKGAVAGAAIGGLAGNASKGAKIGATTGFVVDVLR